MKNKMTTPDLMIWIFLFLGSLCYVLMAVIAHHEMIKKKVPKETKLQKAINLIWENGGGTIHLDSGLYNLEDDSTWTIESINIKRVEK